MRLPANELVALLVATSFAAGLNVYATVGTLGLLARFSVLSLPDPLHLLESWWIIAASIVLFVIEFFADKVPAFDLIWNALHTFVRVPIAALLAYAATSQLSPGKQLLATVLGGLIALGAHGGKTAVRAAVTPSPEPISNIGLSFGEDALAIFLTWFATQHPYSAAAIAIVLLAIIIILVRWVVRALRALFRGAEHELAL
jgi:hypothetical protein